MPKEPRRAPRPRKACIFCSRTDKLTEEHIIQDWMRELFPRSPSDTHTTTRVRWAADDEQNLIELKSEGRKQGHTGGQTVKCTCKRCNVGWISELEKFAKPLFLKLINHDERKFTCFEQLSIARVALKMGMVSEFYKPDISVVPQSEREHFYLTKSIPPTWTMWLARYQGTQWYQRIDHTKTYLNLSGAPSKADIFAASNAQSTTFGLGTILLQVVSINWNRALELEEVPPPAVIQLWPPSGDGFSWPPPAALSDKSAPGFANALLTTSGFPISDG